MEHDHLSTDKRVLYIHTGIAPALEGSKQCLVSMSLPRCRPRGREVASLIIGKAWPRANDLGIDSLLYIRLLKQVNFE